MAIKYCTNTTIALHTYGSKKKKKTQGVAVFFWKEEVKTRKEKAGEKKMKEREICHGLHSRRGLRGIKKAEPKINNKIYQHQ